MGLSFSLSSDLYALIALLKFHLNLFLEKKSLSNIIKFRFMSSHIIMKNNTVRVYNLKMRDYEKLTIVFEKKHLVN